MTIQCFLINLEFPRMHSHTAKVNTDYKCRSLCLCVFLLATKKPLLTVEVEFLYSEAVVRETRQALKSANLIS